MKQVRIAELKAVAQIVPVAACEPSTVAKTSQSENRRGAASAGGAAVASMIAYIDASVLLRVALRQSDALPEWPQVVGGRISF
jgi:hypothetical protein